MGPGQVFARELRAWALSRSVSERVEMTVSPAGNGFCCRTLRCANKHPFAGKPGSTIRGDLVFPLPAEIPICGGTLQPPCLPRAAVGLLPRRVPAGALRGPLFFLVAAADTACPVLRLPCLAVLQPLYAPRSLGLGWAQADSENRHVRGVPWAPAPGYQQQGNSVCFWDESA